ncbi:MAG: serine--tRNA ligase [Candidatus Micrarchaeota archaeon]|nr:serine--tRNA ligase [Candidatus Micrarchaeota archaeon]
MLNAKYVRDNLDAIRASLKKRKSDYPLEELLKLDEEYRKIGVELQDLRMKRNKGSIEVSELKKAKKEVSNGKMKELADLKERIDGIEASMPSYETRIDSLVMNMPNILDENVPYGKDDKENVEIRKHGAIIRKSSPSHEQILTKLGLIDLEQASRIAGARFFYLKGDLALLEQALIRFAIDELVAKGYTLIAPPLLMRREFYKGVTAFGDFEDMLYKAADPGEAKDKKSIEHMEDELYMIGTSEHPIAAMYADKVLSGNELPKRFIGISPCFRREAGAHGKDTKGIFRVHHFYKVEQFIFSKKEESQALFGELIENAEGLFKKLKIPYRVVDVCTGDIGTVAARKNDIEAYMPAQQEYREMVSCSNCTDWQALRLNIKYDDSQGKRQHAHTLNSTAIATTRALVAIVENYYNDDGTITVPDVLVKYMGKSMIGKQQ